MSDPRRLKAAQVAEVRAEMLRNQRGRCSICQGHLAPGEAALDHDHKTGAIRGVLHRGCNSLLGKVENNYQRYGVRDLHAFMLGLSRYLHQHNTNRTGLLHPTFKTDEEKRLARNAKARKRRAARND